MNGEISPDDVTSEVLREEEKTVDSTIPEKTPTGVREHFWGKRQNVRTMFMVRDFTDGTVNT